MKYVDTSNFELHISNSRLYQRIAHEHLLVARQYSEKKNTAKTLDEFAEMVALSRKHSIITIVFSHMALEAFINTYSLRNMSRSQHKKNYRYQNLHAKWAKIPEHVTGKTISPKNLKRLENLEEMRHGLVHSEPVKLPKADNVFRELSKKIIDDIIKGAEEAVETIDLLARDLVTIDPNEQNHVLFD